jgi:hypothetical protein
MGTPQIIRDGIADRAFEACLPEERRLDVPEACKGCRIGSEASLRYVAARSNVVGPGMPEESKSSANVNPFRRDAPDPIRYRFGHHGDVGASLIRSANGAPFLSPAQRAGCPETTTHIALKGRNSPWPMRAPV